MEAHPNARRHRDEFEPFYEDVPGMLEYWAATRRRDFEPAWIAARLRHLYGSERAGGWLARSEFDPSAGDHLHAIR